MSKKPLTAIIFTDQAHILCTCMSCAILCQGDNLAINFHRIKTALIFIFTFLAETISDEGGEKTRVYKQNPAKYMAPEYTTY